MHAHNCSYPVPTHTGEVAGGGQVPQTILHYHQTGAQKDLYEAPQPEDEAPLDTEEAMYEAPLDTEEAMYEAALDTEEAMYEAALDNPFNSKLSFARCRLHPASNGNSISESHSEYEGHAHHYVITITSSRGPQLA